MAQARVLGRFKNGVRMGTEGLEGKPLQPRERQVLRLLAEGLTNRGIALRLGISHQTVKNHNSHIYEKLQVQDRAGAVAAAFRFGVIACDGCPRQGEGNVP